MSQVTVNGNTYSDDGTTPKDMRNGGFRDYLIPMLHDAATDIGAKQTAAQAAATTATTKAGEAQATVASISAAQADVTAKHDAVVQLHAETLAASPDGKASVDLSNVPNAVMKAKVEASGFSSGPTYGDADVMAVMMAFGTFSIPYLGKR